jgi:hypothetical protein
MGVAVPAGWYPDPAGGSALRWWNGEHWTEAIVVPVRSNGAEEERLTEHANDAAVTAAAPIEDMESASNLVVTRWTRYGHDRLYVSDAAGLHVGYWDNHKNIAVLADPARRVAFDAALAAYGDIQGQRLPTPTQALSRESEPSGASMPPLWRSEAPSAGLSSSGKPPEDHWIDLADNPPGAAARAQAIAQKQAAPVKTVLARVLGVHNSERAWRIGADGEEAVALRLLRLGVDWKILHAIPVGHENSDIDHVVIGPGGVYTINAKHHPDSQIWVGGDTFLVNGHKQLYVKNSRFEAKRAAELLGRAVGFPVPVIALIVIVGAHKGMIIKAQPPGGDVIILGRKEIDAWLSDRPQVLVPSIVDLIYDQARRSTTWVPNERAPRGPNPRHGGGGSAPR